jgi:hypothetical protein
MSRFEVALEKYMEINKVTYDDAFLGIVVLMKKANEDMQHIIAESVKNSGTQLQRPCNLQNEMLKPIHQYFGHCTTAQLCTMILNFPYK